jgi:hypothetical protein
LRSLHLAALFAVFIAAVTSLAAAEPAYIGIWKFTGAVVAPWADPQPRKPDVKERARLIDKTVTIGAKAIAGPVPFPCKGAHYAVKDYNADLLFQGAFEEMRSKDKSVDPSKLAVALGELPDAENRLRIRLPFRRRGHGGSWPQRLCL